MLQHNYPSSSFIPSEPLEDDIKTPIQSLINHLFHWKGMPIENAFDIKTICTFIFIHIDFLGYLFSGGNREEKSSAKDAVAFMRKYFGQVDARYKECSGLIYYTLRHGLVHKSHTKYLKLPNGNDVKIIYVSSSDSHLKTTTANHETNLKISVSRLYKDMLSAIDEYCNDYRSDNEVHKNCISAYEKLHQIDSIEAKHKYITSYITDNDVRFLMS